MRVSALDAVTNVTRNSARNAGSEQPSRVKNLVSAARLRRTPVAAQLLGSLACTDNQAIIDLQTRSTILSHSVRLSVASCLRIHQRDLFRDRRLDCARSTYPFRTAGILSAVLYLALSVLFLLNLIWNSHIPFLMQDLVLPKSAREPNLSLPLPLAS